MPKAPRNTSTKPPAAAKQVAVTLRLPADLIAQIDSMASQQTRTRTSQVEHILKQALAPQQ